MPFVFVFLTASKPLAEANLLQFSWPEQFVLFDNLRQALQTRDYLLVIAYINSFILTVVSVTGLVIFASMVAYVWQRRASRLSPVISILVLAGLIVPPAVVPTIWVLQTLGLFKTMPGLIFIEIAFGLPFCILLFRAFISTVPRELDEAAIVDGAGPSSGLLPGDLPGAALGGHNGDHLAVGVCLQRLPEPAVLPAWYAERDRPADPVQLQEPVHHPVQPAVRQHLARHASQH